MGYLVFLVLNESPLRGHLWFLGALLYCYLFLLALGEALTAAGHNIQIPYVRNWLFCGIPSFLTGYLICGYKERKEKSPLSLSHIRILLFVSAADRAGWFVLLTIMQSFYMCCRSR